MNEWAKVVTLPLGLIGFVRPPKAAPITITMQHSGGGRQCAESTDVEGTLSDSRGADPVKGVKLILGDIVSALKW